MHLACVALLTQVTLPVWIRSLGHLSSEELDKVDRTPLCSQPVLQVGGELDPWEPTPVPGGCPLYCWFLFVHREVLHFFGILSPSHYTDSTHVYLSSVNGEELRDAA